MNAFRGLWPFTLMLIVRKFFVFVNAHAVRVYKDTLDISLHFMERSCYFYCPLVALNITGPNTLNIDNID